MSGHRKNKALLSFPVYISLLCILQIACAPNDAIDDPESNLIDPDKFALEVKEIYKNQGTDNTITVKITPGSPGMCLGEFFVTASLDGTKDLVNGSKGQKKSNKLVYDVALQGLCLEALFLQKPSNCLGENDTHFAQGKKISFRIKVIPDATIKKVDTYTLTVQVERRGNKPHTETKSITLKANHNGVDPKKQTEEASTSDTSLQTPATVLGTVSGSAIQAISHPTPHDILPRSTEVAKTIDTSPKMLVSDPDLPATPNSEIPTTSPEQIPDASDSATADSADDTNASTQTPASNQFTVVLQDKTRHDGVRNFVIVTIQPDSSGMALQDFFVTATLADGEEGTIMGSSGKNDNGFVYNSMLDTRSLEAIFLIGIDCLGVDDTSFTRGEAISLKIEVRPGTSLKQGNKYALTVQIAYTGSNAHTETQDVKLTTPKKSPRKVRKCPSPRKQMMRRGQDKVEQHGKKTQPYMNYGVL